MNKIELHKNFIKSFEKLTLIEKQKIFDFLYILKNVKKINDLSNVKKLTWYKNFYRYRLWDYRIWFYFEEGNIKILLLRSRWDFYKLFPKNYI